MADGRDDLYKVANIAAYWQIYRGADKSLARPDLKKKQLKDRQVWSDVEVIAAAETWLDRQPSDFFFFEWLAQVRVWSL